MVTRHGALGAWSALGALLLSGCSYLPANQEVERAQKVIRTVDQVVELKIECGSAVFASDSLCAEIVMKDGATLKFDHIGFNAFGGNAVNVFVAEASGLTPRMASCDGVSAPNFHRQSPLGHHFHPTLIDVKDAVFRYREVLQEVQFWPQCPQYWETQDRLGHNYRYCARKKDATEEPPRPNCS